MCYKDLQVNAYQEKCQYSPSKVPTKLGYKGFEITDCFILVNITEVTGSYNNGQLFPFRLHSYDYLKIVNDGRMVGRYCGARTGQNILLTGYQILITFHSDDTVQRSGFLIHFTAGPHGKYFSNVCYIIQMAIEYLCYIKQLLTDLYIECNMA